MTVSRHYIPWYRRGFGTALTGAPAAGLARAALPAGIALTGTTETASLPIELAGPGDVAGLDPREILRCEPYDGCPDVEPGYFPYVELATSDLPWRFSPVGPTDLTVDDPEHPGTSAPGTRLQPWLALVVVPADAATLTPAAAGGLPTLTTTGDQLPPPGESWAWAHVQVSLGSDQPAGSPAADADLTAALTDPSRCVTRILCPRRLDAATRYGAYLVPTYAAGKAVLDPASVGPDPLAPAWSAAGPVQLPVYFQWSFSTSDDGTFESLARRLRPRAAPAAAGGRSVDTSAPGWAALAQDGRSTLMQGALRPLTSSEPPADPALAESLRAAISSAGTEVVLLPPVYGQDYQDGRSDVPSSTDGWLGQLNTDPRRRLVAGLAAWAVAVLQEELADEAWQQLAAAGVPTSATAASHDLATLVASALQTRHGQTTSTPTVAAVAPAAARVLRRGGPLASGRSSMREFPTPLTPRLTPVTPFLPLTPFPFTPPRFTPPPLTPIPFTPVVPATPVPVAPAATAFAPTFAQPAYELVRATAPEWLLPGAEAIPLDSVVLLRSNADFVESYLVGLNHAIAQELQWRSYPLDRDATMFRRFWGLTGGADDTSIADWSADSDLGSHLGGADELVLLLRGSFVARFPTAVIYLSRQAGDGSEIRLMPNLNGMIGLDATFVGFGLTPDQAGAAVTDGGGAWRVVLEEAVDHARFGVDDAPTPSDPAAAGDATLPTWQDLDWGHPALAGRTHVGVAGNLVGVTRPVSTGSVGQATWGLSSGHLASALQQPAFRIRVPLSLWLTPEVPS